MSHRTIIFTSLLLVGGLGFVTAQTPGTSPRYTIDDRFSLSAWADGATDYDQERKPTDIGEGNGEKKTDAAQAKSEQKKEKQDDSARIQLIQRGQSDFNQNCTQCHDAQKSLGKRKGESAWLATVRRMAEKDDADIPASTHQAIAAYLASLGGVAGKGTGDADSSDRSDAADAASDSPSTTVFGTVSPLWRGGNDDIQNPGFFGDVWVGIAHSNNGPISARVTSCISCHNESDGGFLSRIELVEAVVRLDLNKLVAGDNRSDCEPIVNSSIEAGRLIVPFGAFSSQVNPGVYRTVTRPLMYNMGQRVYDTEIGDPVLPMPYADEGVNWNNVIRFGDKFDATFESYAVNGLQGGNGGIDFDQSRDYVDNNKTPSVGGRATIGTKKWRLGSSIMGGRFNSNTGDAPFFRNMDYTIYGADAVFRHKDIFRFQFEYAQRDSERVTDTPVDTYFRERVGGYYIEAELLLSRDWKTSLLARYDVQTRHGPFPPPEAAIIDTGDFAIRRFTYGLNWSLPGGNLFMLNHEHWFLSNGLSDIDVLGMRLAVSF